VKLPVKYLGQSGWKIKFPTATLYIDPYLSNSVQELDAPDLVRLQPIAFPPETATDADYILITHEHMDHCDPHTLPAMAKASPNAKFIGPWPVLQKLREWGVQDQRCTLAVEAWQTLVHDGIKIIATPAAHLDIERDAEGRLSYVGFVIEFAGERIYIAGDTCVKQEIIDAVAAHAPIHTAVLPVNEHNYYRGKRGIVGNMSIREAFQFAEDVGAKNVVAVHWDMFAINAAYPEEIRLLHSLIKPNFKLHIRPDYFDLSQFDVSVVIRTLNESRYLEDLIVGIKNQQTTNLRIEVVVVDSGSTDGTVEIAQKYGCHIEHIKKSEFSFGRSLNQGCRAAAGEILVITSGHCVPCDEHWLQNLCRPIQDGIAQYTYGRQLGGAENNFSEHRIFAKYYPDQSQLPQEGFFCNNANSAIHRDAWGKFGFDEELTGLEDMELAQRLVQDGGKVAYCANAAVYHHHTETWPQVRRRFEREAIALQKIMPQLQVSLIDTLRYIFSSCAKDLNALPRDERSAKSIMSIVLYRWHQYFGSWRGNHEHRKLSHHEKEKYFYPN
jgi:L-ascorbate metabolism protein UlaG (beta-lactamase superfamily)/glycosyltransferase involved in cell wall biosynthesis